MTRRNPNKTCGKKIPYNTAKLADKAIESISKRKGFSEDLHSYYCPYCLYWHIGHNKRRKK